MHTDPKTSQHPRAFPTLGDKVPRGGNLLSCAIGKLVVRLTGWRVDPGPPNLSKFLVVVAPHTSNWDAIYGLCAISGMRLRINWMVKDSVFVPVLRGFLKALGGIPVDRSSRHGIVEQTAAQFAKHDQFILALTPEGTRKRVEKWKTGFYHMAVLAKVPMVTAFFDYERRVMGFGQIIEPSGDLAADLGRLQDFFATIKGKHPENFNPEFRAKSVADSPESPPNEH